MADESQIRLTVDEKEHDSELESPSDPQDEKKKVENKLHDIIRSISIACDQKNIIQTRKLRSTYKILQNNQLLKSLDKKTFSSSQTANTFKRNLIKSLLDDECYQFLNDKNEQYFITAAKLEVDELAKIIDTFDEEDINQLKNTESVLTFTVKYSQLENENFLPCVTLLIDKGVNVNKYDGIGKTAIDIVALLHQWYNKDTGISEKLEKVADLLLTKGVFETENEITKDFIKNVMNEKEYKYVPVDDESKLFYLITKNKAQDFVNFQKFKNVNVNCNNGENTLLQFASAKSDNMAPVVQCLLNNGADPNKVTKWNERKPLEIAGLRKHQEIFEILLKWKNTVVDKDQYYNFVRWRLHPMKSRFFELLLESDKINPGYIYEKTGNTPLHYAIIFSHKKAIQNLLKRGSSLMIENKLGKRALDIINPADLENFFDSCVVLDHYYSNYFTDIQYKMKFRFNCLIDEPKLNEMNVITTVGKSPNLKHILSKPFIHTFIELKWYKTKFYFSLMLFLQCILFISLSALFHDPPDSSLERLFFALVFSIINIVLKGMIFLNFKIENKWPVFFVIKYVRLHGTMEILLIITIIGSYFQNQIRAFLFIEVAVCFLLSAGYHPKLSKWSVMLQKVFKTFSLLLMFFFLLVLGFSGGFRILFQDEQFFNETTTSVFKTFMMTTGEFEAGDIHFNSGFGGYLLFLIFAMSMTLVIVNFWTGVAVTDIERIEKESETNAFKNVIIFMMFVEYIYSLKYFKVLRRYNFMKPLLFLSIDPKTRNIIYDPVNSEVNFYVNKSKQFDPDKGLPAKIDQECLNKIRAHYCKAHEVSEEEKILKKLEELTKMVNELKSSIKQNESGRSESRTKLFKKKPEKQST